MAEATEQYRSLYGNKRTVAGISKKYLSLHPDDRQPRGRPPTPPTYPDGAPTREWLFESQRYSEWTARLNANLISKLINRFGLDTALHGDLIELMGLNGYHTGDKRRDVNRAQRTLRTYHGLPELRPELLL